MWIVAGKQEVWEGKTHSDMGVMVMLGLFSFGQCTPRSGSAYLLHVHSLMPDNIMLQAAASCLCVCVCPWFEAMIWGVWFVDMISFNWFVQLIAVPHLLSKLHKTNTSPLITPAVLGLAIKKRTGVTNERTAWHPHEVSGQLSPL